MARIRSMLRRFYGDWIGVATYPALISGTACGTSILNVALLDFQGFLLLALFAIQQG